jgi:hypothetical protein
VLISKINRRGNIVHRRTGIILRADFSTKKPAIRNSPEVFTDGSLTERVLSPVFSRRKLVFSSGKLSESTIGGAVENYGNSGANQMLYHAGRDQQSYLSAEK